MQSTSINLPFVTATAEGPVHMELDLTRAKFQELTADLLEQVKKPFEAVLQDAGLGYGDIDHVVLVGGSTRMPAVVELVESVTGKEANKSVNPDEVVALGAAIQAGILKGDVRDVLLLDVTPLSLGIETKGQVMHKLIERNTTIPVRRTETFTTAEDSQSTVEIHVLQGERDMATYNKTLGKFQLVELPPAPRGVPQIEVTFDIDGNGIVHVSAKDRATEREQSITITGQSALSKHEIERMVKDAEAHAAENRTQREDAEVRNNADLLVYQTEKLLKDVENFPADEKRVAEDALAELKTAIAGTDSEAIKDGTEKLMAASQTVSPKLYDQASATGGAGRARAEPLPTPTEAGNEPGEAEALPSGATSGSGSHSTKERLDQLDARRGTAETIEERVDRLATRLADVEALVAADDGRDRALLDLERRSKEVEDPPVTWEDFTVASLRQQGVFVTRETLDNCTSALSLGKPLLLVGPPGTGKSSLARTIARTVRVGEVAPDLVEVIALPSWDEEDLIGRPSMAGHRTVFEPGPLVRALEQSVMGRPTWLLIDELNRAYPDIMLIALFGWLADLPGSELAINYTVDGRQPTITTPSSFRLICAMNDVDTMHLFSLSESLLNRFRVVRMSHLDEEQELTLLRHKLAEEPFASSDIGTLDDASRRIVDLLKEIRGLGAEMGAPRLQVGSRYAVQILEAMIPHGQAPLATTEALDQALLSTLVEPLRSSSRDVLERLVNDVLDDVAFPLTRQALRDIVEADIGPWMA